MGRACSTHGRDEKCIQNLSESLKGRDHSEDQGMDGKILEWIFRKQGGKVWAGCIWLRIGTNGRIS
jgi:hypothetical protein